MRLYKLALRCCMAAALVAAVLMLSACSDLFTASLASGLARDIDYSSLSLSELASLASSRGKKNSDVAREIMAALANFDADSLAALSVEDKAAILDTATNAAFPVASIIDLIKGIQAAGDAGDLIEQIIAFAGSDVDMTAARIILADEETLSEAPVDSLLFASVALIVSLGEDDANSVIEAIESEDLDSLSENLVETAKVVLVVADALAGERADDAEELAGSLGFDLSALIPGLE